MEENGDWAATLTHLGSLEQEGLGWGVGFSFVKFTSKFTRIGLHWFETILNTLT